MNVTETLKILGVVAIAATSIAAVGAPMQFLPAAIEGARIDGGETAANTIQQDNAKFAFVRSFEPNGGTCASRKAGKLATAPKVRAPECAFPILL